MLLKYNPSRQSYEAELLLYQIQYNHKETVIINSSLQYVHCIDYASTD